MNTAYCIEAIVVDSDGVEHKGRWLIRALNVPDACREIIHRLAENDYHVRYYTRIRPRSLKP